MKLYEFMEEVDRLSTSDDSDLHSESIKGLQEIASHIARCKDCKVLFSSYLEEVVSLFQVEDDLSREGLDAFICDK